MRIAQVAPLYESVPPRGYGGTERVVSALTEDLVRVGHDVTLFASGDSQTSARLVPACERALRLDGTSVDHLSHHVRLLELVFSRLAEFDVIHFHVDYLHFPLSRRHAPVQVTTLHGRLDLPDLVPLYREFTDMPLVSISEAQREPIPWAAWKGTVHHGLPLEDITFHPQSEGYLAFIGRISPEKRVDRAIEIAGRAGLPLRVAAKIDPADRAYFESHIAPLLRLPHVDFVGEIGPAEKSDFLGGARALLFPIDWPEPFGLVMIEALAAGTPVIAWRRGSVPEVIEDGRTGFLVDDLDEAVAALQRIDTLSRQTCRETFEDRFAAARMSRDYERIYVTLLHEAAAGLTRGDGFRLPLRARSGYPAVQSPL